ncbi:MAG TPA: hypothetical protein PLD73_01045 [Candidatus Hydrogenedentes bacterium]|nr:hypothetical protein [Candidatus Hydrogenedentota bacterium]
MAKMFADGMSAMDRAPGAKSDLIPQLITQTRELEHQVARMALLNQSLWELLCERLGLTEQELEAKVREVDLRDGVLDGKITNTPVKCPQCGRVSASKHYRCLYCGLEFEKPVMG